MKFIIQRTSLYDSKPCKEAQRIIVPYWHTRTCTEENFNIRFAQGEGKWRDKGKNHKEIPAEYDGEKNWIIRQEENREVWGIKIKSLKELLIFEEKYGRLIVSTYDYGGESNIKSIEIYDSWRE